MGNLYTSLQELKPVNPLNFLKLYMNHDIPKMQDFFFVYYLFNGWEII